MAMKPVRSHYRLLLAGAALALAAACSSKSPTEPAAAPVNPKVPVPPTTFALSVTANPTHLTVSAPVSSAITVRAVNVQDGTPPPDLTPVTLTTTLGEFTFIGSGTQSINLQLVHGQAQAVLFPGIQAGTATLGATSPSVNNQVFLPGAATVVIMPAGALFLSSIVPNTGDPSGGTPVTVTGGGFIAPVILLIGGGSAIVKSVTPNTITAVTPPAPSPVPVGTTLTVDVTVFNNQGGINPGGVSLNRAFTYVAGGGGIQQPQVFSVSPASGTNDGGTVVTIVGQGFVSPVQVLFGTGTSAGNFNGVEATVQSVTANQIVAISPPARGFGQDNTNLLVAILVKNLASGFATIDQAAFKYGSKVIVTSEAPGTTVFNQQVKVTIFGQGFAAPVAVGLAGVAAQVLNTSGTEIQVLSGIPIVGACANITGPVHVTNINNSDGADGPSFTYLVPKPFISNVQPSSGPQGGGTLVTISGFFPDPFDTQVLIGNESAFPPSPNPSTTSMIKVITPAFSGTFPTQPCTDPATHSVGTMNVPAPQDITVTDALTTCSVSVKGAFSYLPSDTSCHFTPPALHAAFTFNTPHASFTTTFTNTTTGGIGTVTYFWEFGDGGTSTDTSPTHTYPSVAMTYTVTLTATDSTGTTSTATHMVTVPGP
jgi:PKD domain/IPT/TIG domain